MSNSSSDQGQLSTAKVDTPYRYGYNPYHTAPGHSPLL